MQICGVEMYNEENFFSEISSWRASRWFFILRFSHFAKIDTDFDCARDRRNIESRKSTRSNEFRNRAEEKLLRKVTRGYHPKGRKRKTRPQQNTRLKGKRRYLKKRMQKLSSKSMYVFKRINDKSCDWIKNRESRHYKQKKEKKNKNFTELRK